MRLPEPVHVLVGRARRRLLLMDVTRRLVMVTAIVGFAASAAIGIGRYRPASWVEPASLVMLGAVWLVAFGRSMMARPSWIRSAIETDQRMGGFDRVSTAVELSGKPTLTTSEEHQLQEAGRWATNRPLTGFERIRPAGSVLPLAVLGVAAAIVLAVVPSRADAVVEQQQIEEALIEEEAAALEEHAPQLTPELEEQLAALVEELREAESLEEAIVRLGEARQELAEQADPALLARKTTMAALEREMERRPLAAGSDLGEQLRQLAGVASSLSPGQALDAAARLDGLAAVAEADATLAEQLAMAADALEAGGDPSFHLEAAAGAVADAADQIAAGEATAVAQAALRDALDRLEAAQGQGQGQGQGEGQGQGQGQGQVSGGNVSGGGGSGTPSQGGLGTGTVTPGPGDEDPFAVPGRADVFDPVDFSLGDEVRVDFEGNDPGDVVGQLEGFGLRNLPTVPYVDRHSEYLGQALDALDHLTIPTGLQDVVRDYFTKLEP